MANPDGFAAFWSRYPKKLGKDKAEKAWNVLNPQNGLVELILSSIDAHCRTQQWQDLQYIPYPATFLNGKRWEDDLVTPSQPIKPKPDKRLLWKSPDQYRDALKAGRIHPSERIPEWETTPYFVASVAEH